MAQRGCDTTQEMFQNHPSDVTWSPNRSTFGDKPLQMAHSVHTKNPILSRRLWATIASVAEISYKENTMTRAEHSRQEHSAPHGASQATNLSLSPRALSISQSPPLMGHRYLIQLSQRRFVSSGRTLLALLTLGIIFEAAPSAQAAPPGPEQISTQRPSLTRTPSRILAQNNVLPATKMTDSKEIPAATPPRAALMPRATAFTAPQFPTLGAAKVAAAKKVAVKSQMGPVTTKVASSTVGSGKLIRVAQVQTPVQSAAAKAAASAVEGIAPASVTPAKVTVTEVATTLAPAAPAAVPADLGGMGKVINVPTLTLPPLSKPLPVWMQNAAVKVDKLERKPATRLAQNPAAPPIRNPGAPVTNSDRLPNQIEVAVSTFVVLLTTTDLQTVAVADPGVADVAVVNSRSVLLNGKSAGVTSLVIVDGQKIRQYTVRVTPAPGSRPIDVATAIGLPGVTVRPLRDALVLEGEVASGEEARRAAEIAGIYSPKVINQLTIRGQVSQEAGTAAQIQNLINLPNVTVRVSGDNAILSGTVDTPQQIQDADVIARTAAKNVINLLRLPALTPDQVRQSLGALAEAPTGSATAGPVAPGTFAPRAPFIIREAGGSLVLEGVVDSQAAADQALALAGRTGLPILNRLQIAAAPTTEQGVLANVAAAIGRPGVRVSGSGKRIVLEGVVSDTEEAVAVEQIARAFATNVDNLLQTPNPRLVDVDVSIVEISRDALKNLGFTYPSLLDASNSGFVIGQRSVNLDLPGPLGGIGFVSPGTRTNGTQTAFQAALRAQINNEDVRLLSNPRTTVLSGRTATFQVGGQVPVPVSITQSATGTITGISFKDFGVLVDVIPNASPNGAVTMRVKTEISQPDTSIGFIPFAGASTIPGFIRRSAVTEVTTQPGGTIALGGLISTETRTLINKVPVLSRIPILGSLFSSKRFQNDQTELVIFVTPRLLPNPLPAGTTAAAGVVSVGNTTNAGATLGNPGLNAGALGTNAPSAQ